MYEIRWSVLNRDSVGAAMLTVKNDEFWEDVTPVDFGSLPRLQDAVTVVGYPIGGDTISVTSGVVSRIEVTSYVHGATELLGVQVMIAAFQYGLRDDSLNAEIVRLHPPLPCMSFRAPLCGSQVPVSSEPNACTGVTSL